MGARSLHIAVRQKPRIVHRIDLAVGALFAATSLATVLVSVPTGLLADRIGAQRLTAAAAALVTLSAVGQGLAPGFWTLLASRAAFGLAFGAIWTAGMGLPAFFILLTGEQRGWMMRRLRRKPELEPADPA